MNPGTDDGGRAASKCRVCILRILKEFMNLIYLGPTVERIGKSTIKPRLCLSQCITYIFIHTCDACLQTCAFIRTRMRTHTVQPQY